MTAVAPRYLSATIESAFPLVFMSSIAMAFKIQELDSGIMLRSCGEGGQGMRRVGVELMARRLWLEDIFRKLGQARSAVDSKE